jgi:hypothetical protein
VEVVADERHLVVVPHVVGEPQGLLEKREALRPGCERQSEPTGLVFVPTGAEAEHDPPAGEHAERTDRLEQKSGRPVCRARDKGADRQALSEAGAIRQRGVHLEHRCFDGLPRHMELEEVIRGPQRIDPVGIRVARQTAHLRTDQRGLVRPRECDSDLHLSTPTAAG